ATKARQAQSRIKQLERMIDIAPAHVDSAFSFSFREPHKLCNPLVRLDEVVAGYGDKKILTKVRLNLSPESRIGLLGPNGAGKSTLIKTLVGELPMISGERVVGEHARIGYFAQHQVDHLDMQASPLLTLTRIAPRVQELELRAFLGSFGFQGDRVTTTVENFSGGEKARLALALIVWQRPNLLVLDEPTNHLDLEMRHALSMALQDFQGALVVVSHDRLLLSACCDEFLLVADGKVMDFEGSLADYATWLKKWRAEQEVLAKQQASAAFTAPAPVIAPVVESKPAPAASSGKKPNPVTLKAKVEKLEARLHALNAKQAELIGLLNGSEIYEPKQASKLKQALAEKSKVDEETHQVEAEYLTSLEQLESL
ncbi:MAG TPA: ATP-binding cassette domain-containing protein, partial [Fluviicoccus sp.]|nr:ATP-binding cassette domain-containing protein [Fluviicoccus sp.]